ncbi:hypothetical protein HUN03_00238 [Mycoplasmopsis anatis]
MIIANIKNSLDKVVVCKKLNKNIFLTIIIW